MSAGSLSVRTNESVIEALSRLVTGQVNTTEVVRRAIALLDDYEARTAKGMHLEYVSADGQTRETVRYLF